MRFPLCLKIFLILIYEFNDFSGNARDNGIRRHVFCHDGACGYDGIVAERYSR